MHMSSKVAVRRVIVSSWSCLAVIVSACWCQSNFAQDNPVPPTDPVPATANELPAQQPATQTADESEIGDTEVPEDGAALMHGPVHEAFAEQFSANASVSEVIGKEPPEPINEEPPEFRPEGENIQWIPGYWGWDIESEDFLWVTGVWRALPPDQQWIPGYWAEAESGWQWISGFWTAAASEELVYMPTPPESIEAGPSTAAPGDDYFWIPGSWNYDQSQYNWQAGFWSQAHDDWVWIPSRYIWTPSGCIYREGYWDYAVQSRGTMFCPMAFRTGYRQTFRPRYVVETGPLWLANLFVNPRFNHYCFGNYYGYRGNRPVYPWVNYYQRSRGYDPLFSYYAYQNRNTNLIRQIARVERQIANNPQYRTRATVAAQMRALGSAQGPQASWALRAAQLNALASDGDLQFDTPYRFTSLEASRRQEIVSGVNPARELAQQRRKLEQAETREDRQRASRAETQAENRADARAEVRADAQENRRDDARAENKPGDNKPGENPNAGAAGDVKRLTIRAENGANGQRRLDTADPSKARENQPRKTQPTDNRANDQSPNSRPDNNQRNNNQAGDGQPNNKRRDTIPNRNDETRPNRNDPNAQLPNAQLPNAREPGAKEPGAKEPGAKEPNQDRRNPNSANPNAGNPSRGNPSPGNNPNVANPRASNPNERARDSVNSSLDRLYQGLDDKSGPDDASALRDMMRRTPRTSPNAGNPNAGNPRPGGRRNPNANPGANAGPNRRPAGNAPAIRPPSVPRENPSAGRRNPNAGGAAGTGAKPGGGARQKQNTPAGAGNRGGGRPAGNAGRGGSDKPG